MLTVKCVKMHHLLGMEGKGRLFQRHTGDRDRCLEAKVSSRTPLSTYGSLPLKPSISLLEKVLRARLFAEASGKKAEASQGSVLEADGVVCAPD